MSIANLQTYFFLPLGAGVAGTFFGGPTGDKICHKAVIWFSILGVTPVTFCVIIDFILTLVFSAIVVHAQELVLGNVEMITDIFDLIFGFGAITAKRFDESWTVGLFQ